jgi:Uma2 family endonuclease
MRHRRIVAEAPALSTANQGSPSASVLHSWAMATAAIPSPSLPTPTASADREQRMLIHGVSWKDYVVLREALDIPSLRMTFCEGILELMSPSFGHEADKKSIARLIEYYGFFRQLRLNGYGSTTFRREAKQRGAEPDECYSVGRSMKEGDFPDIVLEVIQTTPLLDKLTVYAGFPVPEVWIFRKGSFELYRLAGDHYDRVERSGFFPDLDFALIARLAAYPDQQDALNELRGSLE